jgi:NitT/TauT family transport system permease protein
MPEVISTPASTPSAGKSQPASSPQSRHPRHRASRHISTVQRVVTAVAFFALLIAAWHFLVKARVWSPVLLPPPLSVWEYLMHTVKDGDLLAALVVTSKRLLIGYFVGVIIGIPLGVLTARFNWAHDTIGVMGLGLQTLPSVCWVPLALLWFGQTEGAMLFVVVMGTLWSVQIAVDNGVRNVPPIFARAARTMGSKGLHTWWSVIIPASLPFIVSGVKQGWAFAWRSLMAAEIYVTILTGFGLGHLLHYGRELNAMDQVLGVMLVIVLIGLLADKILFSPWERFLHRRWGTSKA